MRVVQVRSRVGRSIDAQFAGGADVVHAITYLKHPADTERIRERPRRAGCAGFPHALVASRAVAQVVAPNQRTARNTTPARYNGPKISLLYRASHSGR